MATYEFDGPGALGWCRSASPTQQQLQLAAQANAAYRSQVDVRLYQLFDHFVGYARRCRARVALRGWPMVKSRFRLRVKDLRVGLLLRVKNGAYYFNSGDVMKVELDGGNWFVRPTTGVCPQYFLWHDNLDHFEFAEGPW